MRHSVIVTAGTLVLSLLAEPIAAQSEGEARRGAIGSRVSDYGGFVALDVRFGDMMDEFAAFAGGEAAVLLKRRMYLGIRGSGLATENMMIPGTVTPETEVMGMGYGGLLVGYLLVTQTLADLSLDATLGAGGVGVRDSDDDDDWDGVFVFEPSVTVELKLAPVARIGIGGSYRFVGDVDVPGLRDADLRGFVGLVRLRLGWF